jgi:hypothetical protein
MRNLTALEMQSVAGGLNNQEQEDPVVVVGNRSALTTSGSLSVNFFESFAIVDMGNFSASFTLPMTSEESEEQEEIVIVGHRSNGDENVWNPSSIAAGELYYTGRDLGNLKCIYGEPNDGDLAIYIDPDSGNFYIDRNGNGRIDGNATVRNGEFLGRSTDVGGYDIFLGVQSSEVFKAPPMRGPINPKL